MRGLVFLMATAFSFCAFCESTIVVNATEKIFHKVSRVGIEDQLAIVVSYPKEGPEMVKMPEVITQEGCELDRIETLRMFIELEGYRYPFTIRLNLNKEINCLVWVKNPYHDNTLAVIVYEK